MAWIIFIMIAYLTAIISVPLKKWSRIWPAGITALVLTFLIDSTLIGLGAFSYSTSISLPSGVPVFYWVSSFAGGIILAYFYPAKKQWQFPYVLFTSALFLAMELIMNRLGYIHYIKWNPIQSYFLDVIGFTTTLSMSLWFGAKGAKFQNEIFGRYIR